MTREQQRLYLIKFLLGENPKYNKIEIPTNQDEQKNLLRSLFNVRPPEPISAEFLEVQDAYLKSEIEARGTIDSETLCPTSLNENLFVWQGDITTLKIDAVVNAANSALLGCFSPLHNCIDNIIHTLSGVQLRLACNEIMKTQGHEEQTGKAKITPAFNLPSKYVLHTVGPIISGKLTNRDRNLLASCYNSCLKLAVENNIKSVAFCCISTGVFCFPAQQAAEIAVNTVSNFLQNNHTNLKVVFNVFTDNDFKIYNKLLNDSRGYHNA